MSNICVSNICIPKKELNDRLHKYITDDDLKLYFGDKFNNYILKYSELSKYDSIDQLLPSDKSFIIILLEWGNNIGHWIALSKYTYKGKTVIEYFNSYGEKPSYEIINMDQNKRKELGQYTLYLNKLLNNVVGKYSVLYNKIEFQSEKELISTCGRHVILRLFMMLHFDLDLYSYIKFMKKLKKETKLSYDEIVALFIK